MKVTAVTIPPKPAGRKQWSAEEQLRVVMAAARARESGRGALLRREGLHNADFEKWHAELTEGAKSTEIGKRNSKDKKSIKAVEIRRKD